MKHVKYIVNPPRKLQPILTDSINIAPDPKKIPSHQVGSSGTPPSDFTNLKSVRGLMLFIG